MYVFPSQILFRRVHVDEAVMGPQYTRTEMERATTPLLCLVLLLGLEGKGLDALSPQGCYTNYHHRHLRRGPGDEPIASFMPDVPRRSCCMSQSEMQ